MPEIRPGTKGTLEVEVTDENAISFLRADNARVLATPWMIMYMEMTARDLVKPYLFDGEDTVGTQINVRHLAASPIGSRVRFEAVVVGVEGRRVSFHVDAWDESEKVGEGTHERGIINIQRFAERLDRKRKT
jgi:fluoroacetyl-CoA thioesterase